MLHGKFDGVLQVVVPLRIFRRLIALLDQLDQALLKVLPVLGLALCRISRSLFQLDVRQDALSTG